MRLACWMRPWRTILAPQKILLMGETARRYLSLKARQDVVIVGGGIMGSSIAYFTKKKAPSCNVCVIEKDSTYQQASTTLSVASIRQQFSIPENILMSMWSYNFLQSLSCHLHIPGNDPPDIQFKRGGYMFLASEQGINTLKENHQLQRALGADVDFLSVEELSAQFPYLNVTGLAAGCVGRQREGWFDPWSLLACFRKKAIAMGVQYIDGEVTKLLCEGSSISGVKVTRHKNNLAEELECSNVVVGAGPWAGYLVESLGINLPVRPRKRYVFVFNCPKLAAREMPLVVDPSGTYVRPEGNGTLFLSGRSPDEEFDVDATNLDVDYDFFNENVWPFIAERIPAFEEIKVQHSWAGYYDYNTFDQNAIIGPHPEISNLYFANGFSGHGIQQGPAVGDAVSELILHGCYGAIDLSRFSFQRLIKNTPLKEKNVV